MSFDPSTWSWLWALRLAGFLALGGVGGAFYFYAVWRNALALAGGAGLGRTLAFMLGRFVLLGALLVFAALHGAGPLLASAAGVLTARVWTLRQFRESAPKESAS
jgi:hypothetical protein